MGVGLSSMQQITGALTGAALAATKIAGDLSKDSEVEKVEKVDEGIDAKMATKARRMAQQKINAIYANKEISSKAKTRRIGKVLDEMGGKK